MGRIIRLNVAKITSRRGTAFSDRECAYGERACGSVDTVKPVGKYVIVSAVTAVGARDCGGHRNFVAASWKRSETVLPASISDGGDGPVVVWGRKVAVGTRPCQRNINAFQNLFSEVNYAVGGVGVVP